MTINIAQFSNRLVTAGIIFFMLLTVAMAGHGEEEKMSVNANGVAIEGYDTVAYFTDAKATTGDEKYTYLWQGAKWRFSSQTNRALFISNPEKYAPQFGAFCALGVTFNQAVPVDPKAWTIVEGRLFLNHNIEFRSKWRKDKMSLIKKADGIWSEHK
jgi:YHS domain-containing protein